MDSPPVPHDRHDRGSLAMLAPLPRLYRVALTLLVLVLGIAGGVVVAQMADLSFPLGGLLVGSIAGLGVGFLLVHDFRATS